MLGCAMGQELKYQRSSLHIVQLSSEEPATDDPELEDIVRDVWKKFPFPDKYNKHNIDFDSAKVRASNNSLMGTIQDIHENGFPKKLNKKDIKRLKRYKDALMGGKKYIAELQIQIDSLIKEKDVARKLVMKWFSIQEDGTTNTDLLLKRSAFNMNATDVSLASTTVKGAKAIADQNAEEMINTTFVAFSMMSFYKNEPIAAAIRDISILLSAVSLNPLVYKLTKSTANKIYNKNKDGYIAVSNTLLYQLVWTDSIQTEFYNTYIDEGRIDMNKFMALNFEMKYIGSDNCTTPAPFVLKGKSKKDLVTTVSIRNLNKQFAHLQKQYEVFRPVAPIICTEPLMADIGTKEGLKGGEKFEILMRTQNPQTEKLEYKRVGTIVRVKKKSIWDNNFDMVDNQIEFKPSPKQTPDGKSGTVLSPNSSEAMVGMVVRQLK